MLSWHSSDDIFTAREDKSLQTFTTGDASKYLINLFFFFSLLKVSLQH